MKTATNFSPLLKYLFNEKMYKSEIMFVGNGKHSPTNNKLPNGNSTSNIPLLRKPSINRTNSNSSIGSNPTSPTSKIPVTTHVDKWREKCEVTEQKRKSILIEKEKTLRQYNDLQRKHLDLQVKHDHLETELFEANENFTKLRLASETLFKQYEILKNQYETETGAMARALKDASQWYQENKELKRRTLCVIDGDTVDEGVDADNDSNGTDADIENLNKTIKQLSGDIAELQTELDSVKHNEFQTNEENIRLSDELEAQKVVNRELESRIAEISKNYEQVLRVSDLLTVEIQELKKKEADQRNNAVVFRREADGYKKERNVLAHQSTLLLHGLTNAENSAECMHLLLDIEQLKRQVEDERIRYEEEIAALQEKIDDLENNPRVEVLEERLNLAEAELEEAVKRAQRAEEKLKAPPAPPPPPPPPVFEPQAPVRLKRRSRVNVLEQVADAIGVEEVKAPVATTGVNNEVINAIKLGNFTLRKTKNEKKERDGSNAVSELLNILGNLKRTAKKRKSVVADA